MSPAEKTTSLVNEAKASESLLGRVTEILFSIKRDGWKANPVQAMEDEILDFFSFHTYGKPLTNSALADYQVAAVIQVEAYFQDKFEPYFSEYFGQKIDGKNLTEEAAGLPTTAPDSFTALLVKRIPGEIKAFYSNLSHNGKYALAGAAIVAITLIINAAKK
jgi:hypothetical protein